MNSGKQLQTFLDAAKAAAQIGTKILRENLGSVDERSVSQKEQFDFVTHVDYQSESAIREYLTTAFPDHEIFAEEGGGDLSADGYLWIIDPLDGTKNYIHEFPVFAVSIALKRGEDILVGVVSDPVRDELFYAIKGQGAYLNGKTISVSKEAELERCLLGTGFPFRAREITAQYFEVFTSLFQKISDFRRAGAAAIDLAYVACGRLDGFWEYGLNAWDIAAGALLIQESGGQVSDFHGNPTYLETGHVVASNQKIHDKIVSEIRKVF